MTTTSKIYVLPIRTKRDVPGLEVNVTSNSPQFKALSPFNAGPCKLYGDYTAQNVENAWQFCKVYFISADAEPLAEYWEWAVNGWNDKKAHRFPMGRGARPQYSLWDGEHLDYIEARKKIYAPLYCAAVKDTNEFTKLANIWEKQKSKGENLILLDHDGWDHHYHGSLVEVINDPNRKMGHGFVLAGMLMGDYFWEASSASSEASSASSEASAEA